MNNWFEVKIKYEKMAEEGQTKKISEKYLIDALSFSEAEERIFEEMKPFISGNFSVDSIKRLKINEMFENENGDKWYSSKVYFITLDEEKGVERQQGVTMYVQASDIKEAEAGIVEGMKGTMADYKIGKIVETDIEDIFKYVK